MNLFLHNIGDINSQKLISPADSLIAASDTRSMCWPILPSAKKVA